MTKRSTQALRSSHFSRIASASSGVWAGAVALCGDDAGGGFGRLGDGVEEFGKVAHHVAGLAEDGFVVALAEFLVGVGDEEAAGLVAEPADQADVLGEGVHLADAVEGVLGAGLLGVLGVGGGL